jgi:hypothetical protein
MRLQAKPAVTAGIMALAAPPAVALAAPGTHHNRPTTHSTGTNKAKAYGKFCRGESQQHVAGQRGTSYSICVSGAKKLLKQQAG